MRPFRYLKELRPADVERLIDAIERRLRDQHAARLLESPTPDEPAPRTPDVPAAADRREEVYGAALRYFGQREEGLREDARVTDRLLTRLRDELPAIPQQVLPCRAPEGGIAGGRIRVRNASSSEAQFAFRPRFEHPARFVPPRFTLAPGASQVVDVRVDLAGRAAPPTGREVLLVDVLADGRAALKLWIDVESDRTAEGP